jgi:hypothetical protein
MNFDKVNFDMVNSIAASIKGAVEQADSHECVLVAICDVNDDILTAFPILQEAWPTAEEINALSIKLVTMYFPQELIVKTMIFSEKLMNEAMSIVTPNATISGLSDEN